MSAGRVMFSRAVSVGSRLNDWKMNPTWSRRSRVNALSDSAVSSVSPTNTRPAVGVSSPARQCINVDFPDPDGPMIAANSPAANATSTPSSATTLASPVPYTFDRPTAWAATLVSVTSISLAVVLNSGPPVMVGPDEAGSIYYPARRRRYYTLSSRRGGGVRGVGQAAVGSP